jgi:hypothetical protein
MILGAHLFGLPNVSQASLEPASGGVKSPPVLSVKCGTEKFSMG